MMKNFVVRPDPSERGIEPVRLKLPVRIFAGILAPVLLWSTVMWLYETVQTVLTEGWASTRVLLGFTAVAVVGRVNFVWRLFRAAATGLDSHPENVAKAHAEHRAMLAALRATGGLDAEHPQRLRE